MKGISSQEISKQEEENGTILSGRNCLGEEEDLTHHIEREYVHKVAID